jgi:hypothetical protein
MRGLDIPEEEELEKIEFEKESSFRLSNRSKSDKFDSVEELHSINDRKGRSRSRQKKSD